jgi:predicted O-linked N-acetylglucosamine transferase (SPINDLY family)
MQQENQISDLVEKGIALHHEGKLEEAEAIYQLVLAIEANHFDALQLLGALLVQTKQFTKALNFLTKALQINPDYPEAHSNYGLALKELRRLEEALLSFNKAIEIKSDYAEAYSNRGNALKELQRFEEALVSYDKAIEIKSNLVEAHFNRGNILNQLQRLEEALTSYDKAIEIKPDYAEAYSHRGNTLNQLQRLEEALTSYNKAIEIKPNLAETHCNRGLILKDLGRISDAKKSFVQALSLEPDFALARWGHAISVLPIIQSHIEDSRSSRIEFSQELSDMEIWFTHERLEDGHKSVGSVQPFYLAYQEVNNRELLSRYGALCQRLMRHWQQKAISFPTSKPFNKPIKLGIVSRHIHQHPVWDAITRGWVEHLDRNRFELIFFYTGYKIDKETEFAKSIAKDFITCGDDLSSWVNAIIASQIDILLYPEIGIDPMSAKLANLRLAPVQVASWGHPDTTGFPTIDYYLSADLFEPDNAEKHYTEQLIKLPNLGSHHKPSNLAPVYTDLEKFCIKADQPLLLCPGTPFKYQPQYDHIFVDIAKRLGKCQFIFFTYSNKQLTYLLKERLTLQFLESGLNIQNYCVFIPWQPKSAFYGLMNRADIYLDTIGFSGFNTAFQAIECGLPVVTREGRFMRGRLASGILKRIGLQELIAQDDDDFVNLIVKIITDQEYYRLISNKILESRDSLYLDLKPIRMLEQFLEDSHLKSKNSLPISS